MNRSLASSISFLLIYCMAFPPCLNAAQLGGVDASSTQSKIALSDAVTSAANINAARLFNKLHDGSADASDVHGALVAVSTLFAHMQETGANDQIQQQILAQGDQFLNSGISEEKIEQQYNLMIATGAKVDLNQYRNSLATTQQQRKQILTKIKKIGIWGVEQQLLAHLRAVESTAQSNGFIQSRFTTPSIYHIDGNALRLAAFEGNGIPKAHLQYAMWEPDCATMAMICGVSAILGGGPVMGVLACLYAWGAAENQC